jgi:hypothetical protein
MSKGFEIEIQGLDKLMAIAEKYPNISEKHINKAINRSLIRIQDQAKKNAPSGDTQQLRQNWKITMGRFAGELKSGVKYGKAIEFGLPAGHYMPVKNNQVFKLWAERRGLNPYAVAKSIAKKGTKKQPFFQQSIDEATPVAQREFDKALEAIIKEL